MSNEYFDKQAAAWDDNPVRRELTGAIAAFILGTISLNKQFSVLDYGCGTGLLSFLLSDKAASICAADVSDGMLAQVRKKITDGNVKNIEAVNFLYLPGAFLRCRRYLYFQYPYTRTS